MAGTAVSTDRIRRVDHPDGIVELRFDRPDSEANVFDADTLSELDLAVEAIGREGSAVRGVVITSAKRGIFIAGADLDELARIEDEDEIRRAVERGQRAFQRVAELSCTTVAAIHGACLGGGFELALACDVRLATTDRATRIGLPEVRLGILPAWGGTTRLPRLLGLTKALPALLTGRRHPAKLAKKIGIVDQLVPREHLLRIAGQWIEKGPPRRRPPLLVNNRLVTRYVRKRALERVQRETQGHYPAPPRIVEVACDGLDGSVTESLALERDAAVELIRSDVSRKLVSVFFLQERAKKLRIVPDAEPPPVERAAVIGAGVMGAGIAQWLASRGIGVILRDLDPERVRAGMASAGKLFADAVRRHRMTRHEADTALDRIAPSHVDVPLEGTDLVIEAVVERMDVKREIFADLDDRVPRDAVLATNTSSLSVDAVAQGLDTPERVLGIHFFNPVHKMQLVEVVRGERTSPETLDRAVRFVQRIGKLPVVTSDRPGFVVNRILMPYLFEAVHLFESGISLSAIDRSMERFGMPMGPLRLLDEVGIDVAAHVGDHVGEIFEDRLPRSGLLARMRDAGRLGRKEGGGFYDHPKKGDPKPSAAVRSMAGRARGDDSVSEADLARRMVLLMVNEAARCLEEEVVGDPRDVDFAMIMGAGFAAFRGGPLRYADDEGTAKIRDDLLRLADTVSSRFDPCSLLADLAKEGRTFYPSS